MRGDPGVAGYRRARHASHWQLEPAGQTLVSLLGLEKAREASWAGRVAGFAFSNAPSGEGVGRPIRTGGCSAQGAGLGERHFGSRISQMHNGGGRSVRSRGVTSVDGALAGVRCG